MPARRLLALAFVVGLGVAAGSPAVTGATTPVLPRFGDVIPRPVEVAEAKGRFTLASTAAIEVRGGSGVAPVADLLAGILRPSTGYALPIVGARGAQQPGSVRLMLDGGRGDLEDEGYELRVTAETVTVTARRPAGLLHGVQTLRQLFPPAIELRDVSAGPWRVRAGVIRDVPRFAWRGAMLDVGRHFFGVPDVERFIDLMAAYKLNTLHLHLSDDQGWRIAIRSWPRLTSIGGRTAVGGGEGGFYTQEQFRDLVAYADRLHVTIVPEIDMPGHTNAALASYAKLNCDGVAPALYTGIEVGFSSLCVDKELTYRFVGDVVRELAELTTGLFIHVGGDEAQATTSDDYRAFMDRVRPIVRASGKRMVGWEEVAKARLPRGAVVQHWHSADLARAAVAKGARLVMSPATKAYLDMKYTPRTRLGLSWAGTTDVEDSYGWDPATQVNGVGEADIVGVEAPLWTETAVTRADLDYLAFPRLLGIAEIGWSPRPGRTWGRYRTRLARQGPRLEALGVGFYRDPGVPWSSTSGR